MELPIYLDYHATTPVDPAVLQVMLPYLQQEYGNASSTTHSKGWVAGEAIEKAREQIAELIGAKPREIYFTSGATESNNWCIKGVFEAYAKQGNHIITTCTEHKAVLDTCRYLQDKGARVTYLDIDEHGVVKADDLYDKLSPETILVSIMTANNEIGTLNDIAKIGRTCRERGVLFHTDAVQGVGLLPFSVQELAVDFVSLSAHKIYGPKGIGALYIRERDPKIEIMPLLHGGGQERGLRAGTLNVPAAVGFGQAAELTRLYKQEEGVRLLKLREHFWRGLQEVAGEVHLNGHPTHRLPNNLNVSFVGVSSAAMMFAMKDILVSSGSACNSAKAKGSHVLDCIGTPEEDARSNIRFSLGRFTTQEQIDYAVKRIGEAVRRLRPKTAG